jgi:hypothetical protein
MKKIPDGAGMTTPLAYKNRRSQAGAWERDLIQNSELHIQ